MKITSFRPLDSDLAALGLKRFEMKKLGRIVILAGPNGSGKTRVLTLLGRSIDPNTKRLSERQKLDIELAGLVAAIDRETTNRTSNAVHIPDWENRIAAIRGSIAKVDAIEVDEPVEQIRLVNFVPDAKDLQDPSDLAPSVLTANAAQAESPGTSGLDRTAPAYIQHLQDRHWEVTHSGFQGATDERTSVETAYARLESLISATLSTKLGRTSSGECTLFGRPIGKAQLSRGQTVLLQFVVAVHPIRSNDGLVLMMDEPETHLHPSALISIIDKIQDALPACQIWMATHSVPLIAHLYADQPEALHFVEGGAVTHAGRKPQIVLRGLLGNEEERMKLLAFSQLPEELAATQFAAACLSHPDVVGHQNDEPQVAQIKSVVLATAASRPVKILDFGAGKGRLLAGLDTPELRRTLQALCAWAGDLMRGGAPLVHRLPGRAGWELRLVVQGGLRILEKIERMEFQTMKHRPTLTPWDAPLTMWRAARMRRGPGAEGSLGARPAAK